MNTLETASAEFAAVLRKYKRYLLLIKGSPDPDAIAASFALQKLIQSFGGTAHIYSPQKISLKENKSFVQYFKIPMQFGKKRNFDSYHVYAVVDHPSPYYEEIPEKLPCAIYIDHHKSSEDSKPGAEFFMRNTKAGSVSSMIALMLREMDIPEEVKRNILKMVGTPLIYGINSDTDSAINAGDLDLEALKYLTSFADNDFLKRIAGIHYSESVMALYNKASADKVVYKDWVIAGLGFINEGNRDEIAITADLLLRHESAELVVVYCLIRKNRKKELVLDASIRSPKASLNLDNIIKRITATGGSRKFKGAFQVSMDYFSECPREEELWELVRATTEERFKDLKDSPLVREISGVFRKLRGRLRR